ncbi:hypothetical protein LSAT2_012406 [Lamellibrachia satsuma]|nr:hypothetical protein LSAT2_012406 [Lamellibrachia satsuma]
MQTLALSVLLLVVASLRIADAVKCHNCNSALTPGCGEPFDASGLVTCSGTFCMFTKTQQPGIVNVVRQCGSGSPGAYNNKCFPHTSGVDVCYCDSDYCNKHGVSDWGKSSGSRPGQTNAVFTLAVFATIISQLRNLF